MFRNLIEQFLPEVHIVKTLFLPLLLVALFAAILSGWMKKKGIRTPYTRKTFHFVIFSLAGILRVALTPNNVGTVYLCLPHLVPTGSPIASPQPPTK